MIRRIIKSYLLRLIKEDYETRLEVLRVGNPALAQKIETGHANPEPPPPMPPEKFISWIKDRER